MLFLTDTPVAQRGTPMNVWRLPTILGNTVLLVLYALASMAAFVVLASAYCAERLYLYVVDLSGDRLGSLSSPQQSNRWKTIVGKSFLTQLCWILDRRDSDRTRLAVARVGIVVTMLALGCMQCGT